MEHGVSHEPDMYLILCVLSLERMKDLGYYDPVVCLSGSAPWGWLAGFCYVTAV